MNRDLRGTFIMYGFDFIFMIIGIVTVILMGLGLLKVLFNILFSREKTLKYYVNEIKEMMERIDDNERRARYY
jgi:hypothetical protein